mgnify:CR=1 FL=1
MYVIVIIVSSAILVHIDKWKVDVSFVATFKIWKHIYLKIRITTFKYKLNDTISDMHLYLYVF